MGDFIITHAGHVRQSASSSRSSFWRRQFAERETRSQLVFDATFGVVAPLLCVIFDPIVFRSGLYGTGPVLGNVRVFAYAIIFIEIGALLAWHFGPRDVLRARILGGVMLAGALFSFVVGIVILPLSLIGLLLAGIGLFGFTPFLTAFIYLRNHRRALKHARAHAPVPGRRLTPVILSAALTLALPAAAQWQVTHTVTHALRTLTGDDAAATHAAMRQLKYVHWLTGVDADQLVWAYRDETDLTRRARLAAAYRELTGEDIAERYARLTD
jgi:hypothetical protein